ncbi:MAG: phosphatidylserine decarboxylase [Pseudomonadota bacterium]
MSQTKPSVGPTLEGRMRVASTGHYEPIVREGYPYILIPALLGTASWWTDSPWTALLFFVATVSCALFFRNPERSSTMRDDLVVAPADGTVMEIVEQAYSPNLDSPTLTRVSIFMSIFNVHVNRSPISAQVKKITYYSGGFLDARDNACSEWNERNSVVLGAGEDSIEVVQVAGRIARRISCWVHEGDGLRQGDRFGVIHFGSRLDVYLPPSFRTKVLPGTPVKAGLSIIAERVEPAAGA